MSVPAANALSPAPVITTARMRGSWPASPQISPSRSYMAKVSELRASGRLKVMRAIPSRTSKSRSFVISPASLVAPILAIAAGMPDDISGRPAAPATGWDKELAELRRREALAREMGGAERVARQHAGGRLTVRERIERMLEPGSFHE